MTTYFDYNNINLIPNKCIVSSRNECDPSIQFGKYKFKLAIVPANMECVINEKLAEELSKKGYFYVMHRFNINIEDFIQYMQFNKLVTSISIGVNEDTYELLNKLKGKSLIPDYITIDIAHGHSIKMENMIKFLRNDNVFKDVFIIAGNVSTIEATKDLIEWGANAIKVGIGPGSACTTYPCTGFGSRGIQASIVEECSRYIKDNNLDAHIIADGGIVNICDIVKSIVLGASMVMIGGMLSGFNESPGKIIIGTDGKSYQQYYGSASEFSMTNEGQTKNKNIEGTCKLVPYKNQSIFTYLNHIKQCIQSAISYGGGINLMSLKDIKYIIKRI
jgi:GMP reductase